MNLSKQDLEQLKELNISIDQFENQLFNFRKGFPKLNLVKPATVQNGIWKLSPQVAQEAQHYFESQASHFKMTKFVPASGMASRMFKHIYNFIDNFEENDANYNNFVQGHYFSDIHFLIKNLHNFPFYNHLVQTLEKQGYRLKEWQAMRRFKKLLKAIVDPSGLNYGDYPKALLPFHTYKRNMTRTAFQEHLIESLHYLKQNDLVHLSFTIANMHTTAFEQHLTETKKLYESKYKVKFRVEYSYQAPHTDIIAVDEDNNPLRLADGKLLFRKGGHGALLDNLNRCKADVIFIKNIDNVAHESKQKIVYRWKKILGGLLLKIQKEIFNWIKKLEANTIEDLYSFAQDLLKNYNISLPDHYYDLEDAQKKAALKAVLNRPIRVCGMIVDAGHAGGGPFWVQEQDGKLSLQIVETAQIDQVDPKQVAILKQATHFSPVDIVCSTKNYCGQKFNLLDYRDAKTGFMTTKSWQGKILKAQELPGLWNGSMANWISIFVEVPKETFTPVKTIDDLLKDGHLQLP